MAPASSGHKPAILSYRVLGDRTQPVITFLHGFLGSSTDWQPWAESLSRQFLMVLLDLPGHGQSSKIAAISLAHTSRSIERTLTHIGISRTALVGYSMGGRCALSFATRFPNRCRMVIVESSHPGLTTDQARMRRLVQDKKRAKAIQTDWPQFMSQWYQHPIWGPIQHHPKFAGLIAARMSNNPAACAQTLVDLSLGHQPNFIPTCRHLNLPIHFIAGNKDHKYATLLTQASKKLSQSSIALVPNAHHCAHFEQPTAVLAILRDRLQEIPHR